MHALNELTSEIVKEFQIDADWHFGQAFRVRWSEVDSFRHAWHLAYLVWCEEVRNNYFEQSGYPIGVGQLEGPVIVHVDCSYQKALAHGDRVFVTGRVNWYKNSSLEMEYAVWAGGLVAKSKALCVWRNNVEDRTISLPDELKRQIRLIDPQAQDLKVVK
jgi:YbgC/YbaW family acyl-CoA thioester hydrolase